MAREAVSGADELLERYARGGRFFGNHAQLACAELVGADLTGADLTGADLRDANLMGANLTRTNLYGADLNGAYLFNAYLFDANLGRANLTFANLSRANLNGTNLDRANLSGAFLIGAIFVFARLSDAKLDGAQLGYTQLAAVNLAQLARAKLVHSTRSSVDWASIVLSVQAPRLKDFLRDTGMPDVFVEYMVDCARSLDPGQIFSLLQSTFISYGGPDEPFAWKLNSALEARGVTTFFFKDDAPPGEKLHRVMRKGVNEHDRVILICSGASLQRPGLINELEETLAREARDGGKTYLIPIRLDDYVLDGWAPSNPDLAQTVRDRVIADFRNHEDPATFDAEVSKLVAVLKKDRLAPVA